MKITIETDCSYEAKVTIDGRRLVFGYKDGGWTYKSGLKKDEMETTIGGMIAYKLFDVLPDILQGWMPEYDNPATNSCWELWDRLDEECAAYVASKLE